jgi:glycosyltransferase involved in cell wall biosynthesis
MQDGMGVVFPQFLYNKETINSSGLIVNAEGAYDFEQGKPVGYYGLMGHTEWMRNFTACREYCFAVKKDVFLQTGGINTNLGTLSMLGFCLSVAKCGYRNMYINYVKFDSDFPLSPIDNSTADYADLMRQYDVPEVDPFSNPVYETLREAIVISPVKMEEPPPIIEAESLQTQESPIIFEPEPVPTQEPPPIAGIWDRYSEDASSLAQIFDFSQEDIVANNKIVTNLTLCAKEVRSICWIVPAFDYASYAGLNTIFRLANYLQTEKGVENCFAIVGTANLEDINNEIARIFPNLGNCALYSVSDAEELATIPHTDAAVATLWTTAYMLLKYNQTYKKFYLIQDYEPYFYPAGSTFAQAGETYRFGFLGIANTQGLKKVYEEEYGGKAVALMPCVDTHVFYPHPQRPKNVVKRVFFYGRPGHPRNGFELGIAAFKALKYRMGDKVEIISAGAAWEPINYGLEGIVNNLGRLPYADTGNLYRTCDAGLIMMFTKHPSYLPFELMACECPVVSNYNQATTWFLKDGVNCLLTEATATRIAETIESLLFDSELSKRITQNALAEINATHTHWDTEMEKVWQFVNSGLLLSEHPNN